MWEPTETDYSEVNSLSHFKHFKLRHISFKLCAVLSAKQLTCQAGLVLYISDIQVFILNIKITLKIYSSWGFFALKSLKQ